MNTYKYTLLSSLVVAALFSSLFITRPLLAADWDTLGPADFIEASYKEVNDFDNVNIDHLNLGLVYKRDTDKNPVFYSGTNSVGAVYQTPENEITRSNLTVTYETGSKKPKVTYAMSVVSDGKNIYFKPEGMKQKQLRNKWIKADRTQYEDIGIGLGATELFSAFNAATEAEHESTQKKMLQAARKVNLWKHYDYAIEDDREVKNATRYNFELNQDSIQPYFKELAKTLTLEEAGYSAFGNKDLIKSLGNKSVTSYMMDKSFMSIWIDNDSKRPVHFVEAIWTPVTEKKKTVYVLQLNETSLTGFNSQKSLQVPTNSVDAVTAAKQLKINLSN